LPLEDNSSVLCYIKHHDAYLGELDDSQTHPGCS
jgi:hypothetical protein